MIQLSIPSERRIDFASIVSTMLMGNMAPEYQDMGITDGKIKWYWRYVKKWGALMFIGDEWVMTHIIDMSFYTKLQEVTKGQVTATELCNVRHF